MLLRPATSKRPNKQVIAQPRTKLAPVGGWNAKDPWAAVPEGQSIVLDNWFPRDSWVESRYGTASHKTGFLNNVRTLMGYTSGSAQKLFAATDVGLFDATTAGAVGSSLLAITNGYCQHTNFQTSANWFHVSVNGSDELQLYDGATWKFINAASTPAITGVVTSTLIGVNVFKRRLFLIPVGKLSFYYLPVDSVGGAAVEFPLGGIFSKGGYLMAMGTWTLDSGAGADDFAVFVTSEGQCAVYAGTDPGNAAAWSLVGVYDLAKPLGRKCFCKYGGDLLLMLEDGIYPLSKAFQSSSIDRTVSISDNIRNAWISSVTQNRASLGWTIIQYQTAPFILINIPIGAGGVNSVQYIMNTQNKRWTRFTGIGGVDFEVLGTNLYYAKGTQVYKAWTGFSDVGNANIVCYSKSGYDAFGYPGNNKQWLMIRPNLQVVTSVAILIGLAVDFREEMLTGALPPTPPSGGIWDTSIWDGALWGSDFNISQSWATTAAYVGHYAATLMQVSSNREQARWLTTDHLFEVGGYI